MLVKQNAAGLDDVFRLVVEKTDRSDIGLEPADPELEDGRRRIGNRVKLRCCLVDADVGCLRRQYDGDEQFERAVVIEFGIGIGVRLTQPRVNR